MSELSSRLRGDALTLGYGKKIVAESLNVTIPDGHFTAIIGPNGCGKSTLLRTLSRLMTPTQGHVFLDGEQIQRFNSKEVARRIGLLAQNATTPGDITVQELVARGRYPHQPLFTRWRKEDELAVTKAMQATGITDLAAQSVDTLSGGQRQRAWIAMVLAQETSIMLLDEPTTWLDISHQIDLLELLSDLNRTQGFTLAAVLHDLNQATPAFITAMLVLVGVGFSLGNYLGGRLADKSVTGTLKGFLLLLIVIMLAIPWLARNEVGAAVAMVVWGMATFAVVPPLQMRVMRVASDAPGLSSSVNIGAFNLGNALGAAAGGAVISSGMGYSFVPVMGAIIAGLGLILVLASGRKQPEPVCATE